MNVSPIFENGIQIPAQNSRIDAKSRFAETLENLKKFRPADYDEDSMRDEDIQTMIQILSDGSTLVTIFDSEGRVISQNKTRAVQSDSEPRIIGTQVESRFGLEELAAQSTIVNQL